jgi:dihydropteroate synthase
MGILNVTRDSFSDGNKYHDFDKAFERTLQMIEEGADIIDIGGESTRPYAKPIPEKEELKQVIPLVKAVRQHSSITISVDTRKAEVAKQAIDNGADIINDISALQYDPLMLKVIQDNPQTAIVLMHMKGQPEHMQDNPFYSDVLNELDIFFEQRLKYCLSNGIEQHRILIDPGIGFGKNLSHNLSILANLRQFLRFQVPVLLGASRKRFIAEIDESDTENRIGGTLAAAQAAMDGGVAVLRVHDVKEHVQFIKVTNSIKKSIM